VVTTFFTLPHFLLKKTKKVKKLKQNSEESNDFKTLSQLGQNYQAKRQLQKALAYSKKAYELVKTEADSDDLIVALVNMGAIYWDMSQLRKATKLFQDSLLIVERTRDNVGRRMLDAAFQSIQKAIKKNKRFSYPSFGTFLVRNRKARKGRNPQLVLKYKSKPARRLVLNQLPN